MPQCHRLALERLARYDNTGSTIGGSADFKLLGIEIAELLDAIDNGTPVEVGPEEGLAAVALVMACHESSDAGHLVTMAEVIDGSLNHYQSVANWELGVEA
jgi:predicted dehydrogenase